MAVEVDDEYSREVIAKGDEGSALLDAVCVQTLRNGHVRLIGPEKRRALQIPLGYRVVIHSALADSHPDVRIPAASLVERLVSDSRAFGAEPIAMADIIDSDTGDTGLLRAAAESMAGTALRNGIAIIAGENAILGSRVPGMNISGTCIGIVPETSGVKVAQGDYTVNGVRYAVFDSEGQFVIANSDGIGTKPEFYERLGDWTLGVRDDIAMQADDQAKVKGARIRVASSCLETRNVGLSSRLASSTIREFEEVCREMDILGIVQQYPDANIRGYSQDAPAFNMGGSVVGTVSEEDLMHPLQPINGDHVIAIRGDSNPRSNGITDKRKVMIELFGENWHKTPEGKLFLEYLSAPSTILYPVFKELVDSGLATGVYHMSGGAYNGKFARPLAKQGMFAQISNLFAPDWRELTILGARATPVEVAYGKFPMGNDGFVTTSMPEGAMRMVERFGLQPRVVGRVLSAQGAGRTGLELKAYNGKTVYFSGKD